MVKLIAAILLSVVAYCSAGGAAPLVVGSGYGGALPVANYGYSDGYGVPAAGVLGEGSYIPGAGFIPGYPFTYMRDSYGGHLPPADYSYGYGSPAVYSGGYGGYGGHSAAYAPSVYGGYGGAYAPAVYGGYGGVAAPVVYESGYGY